MEQKGGRLPNREIVIGSFDDVVQDAQERVQQTGEHADLFDLETGEHITCVTPLPETKGAGYTATFGKAWDQMMERRQERESRGQRATDD